jgi:hypothetical protein
MLMTGKRALTQFLILVSVFNLGWNTFAGAQEFSTLNTFVVDVIEPTHRDENVLVLLSTDGRVLRLSPNDTHDINSFREAAETNIPLLIEFMELGNLHVINEVHEISESELLDNNWAYEAEERIFLEEETHEDFYIDSSVTQFWNFLARKNLRRGAQCFHRAYLWAYDMQKELQKDSQKVFLFFTSRYIREYNYNWWFHVAPYVNSDAQEIVLDPTFTRGPLQMQAWTNRFMANNAYCPTIQRYYGYQQHHQSRHCYLRKTYMYSYHPTDVQHYDRNNASPRGWNQTGLRNSQVARPR